MSVSTICGVPVAAVARPASVDELASVLAAAAGEQAVIGIAGSGSKIEIGGAPDRVDLLVDTRELHELIEYNPHDLVIRAGAGMPLATLQEIAAPNGQWLALDPPEPGATIGGVVAANASGPRRHRYGTVRDLLVGATFVLADGTVAHTGGKVVKNVAGYDLDKLLTGSYGTLAVLADLTFRLHPRPASTVVVATRLADVAAGARLIRAYRRSTLEPTALELRVELPDGTGELTALFEGHERTAHSQASAAVTMTEALARTEALGLAARLVEGGGEAGFASHPWAPDEPGLRLAYPPAALADIVTAVGDLLPGGGSIRARAGVGVLEVAPAGSFDAGQFADLVARLRSSTAPRAASVVVVSASPQLKTGLDVWGPTPGLELMRAIKDQFDRDHRLSPGRFVGGI
jgi:glycolate oxidase FAD binding subunit